MKNQFQLTTKDSIYMMKDHLTENLASLVRMFIFALVFSTSLSALAQEEITVRGTVTDEKGEGLPGATVQIKGTLTGTITDIDGSYTIQVPSDGVLIVSYTGFLPQEVNVSTQTVWDFSLQTDIETLEEVIVVGYGSQKREQIVGAVAQIEGEELMQRGNVSNLSDALSGTIPGVTILTPTGLPGGNFAEDEYSATQIFIRGRSTWNNAGPLILVDGVERDMNDIDPTTVESVSVLKDASATAQFGVRGANGVIQITTKRGKTGKPQLTLEASTSFNAVSKVDQTLEAFEGITARNYAIVNDLNVNEIAWGTYVPQEELNYYRTQQFPFAYPNQDWQRLMMKGSGRSHRLNLNVSGGTEKVNYFTSLSYLQEGDILNTVDVGQGYDPDFSFDRFNFRSNLDFQLTNSTKFSVNLGGYYGSQQRSGANPQGGFWIGLYQKSWDVPVFQYEDGIYGHHNGQYERFGINRFVDLNFSGTAVDNRAQAITDFRLTQDLDVLTEGLSITAQYSYDTYFETNGRDITDDGVLTKWVDPAYYSGNMTLEEATIFFPPNVTNDGFDFYDAPLQYNFEDINENKANRTTRQNLVRLNLNYDRSFGSHTVGGLFLFQREEDLGFRGNAAGYALKREEWVGSVRYNFDGTYFFEFNGAYNGSDQFLESFDFFPSLAVGYTISQYDFFKNNLPFMNHLKVRYSWGIVGNDQVGNGVNRPLWPFVSRWTDDTSNNNSWAFGDGGQGNLFGYQFFLEGTPGNPGLVWETATKHNIGVETGFFDNVITANIDIFWENRVDILIAEEDRNVPDFFGISPPAANLGETENKGFELVVGHEGRFGDLSYWATASYTHTKDRIIARDDPANAPAYQKQAGFQIGQQRATMHTGIINSWDELYSGVVGLENNNLLPGDFRLLDFNGNGVIDPEDRVPFGFPNRPQDTWNLNLGASYKGFSLSALFYGITNVSNEMNLAEFSFDAPSIFESDIDNTFLPEYGNANPTFRSLAFDRSTADGHYNLLDGTFIRLKTIEVAYVLPSQITGKVGMEKVRFFVNGNNLWLWSDLPVDTEGANFNVRNYPVTKQVNVGMNVTF